MRTKSLKFISVAGSVAIFLSLFFLPTRIVFAADNSIAIWPVRSIDTMKMSRDKARAKKDDPSFDVEIEREVSEIESMGANYIALGTPYDPEFIPFLRRWVSIARKHNLHIWYRGTFSGYEGWFGYAKTVSPDELLELGAAFIRKNDDLFEHGDIFDLCPECENAAHWPQPRKDAEYNLYIQKKNRVLMENFSKLNKKVIFNYPSIIGGRSKDVLNQQTFDELGNITALDHYVKDANNYGEYVSYFWDTHHTKVLFSELGAPIPDLHGDMSQGEQAAFISDVFTNLYAHADRVIGLNYWVLSGGTTSLYDDGNTPRKVVDVIKDYFQPGQLSGVVQNTLRKPVADVSVRVDDHEHTKTNELGEYTVAVPAGDHTIAFTKDGYYLLGQSFSIDRDEHLTRSVILSPTRTSIWYWLQDLFSFMR